MQRTVSLLAISTLATVAVAQTPSNPPAASTTDPLDACAQMGDPAARLACFDQQMQRRRGTAAPQNPPSGASGAAAAPQAPDGVSGAAPGAPARPAGDKTGLEGSQVNKGTVDEAPKPFMARVTKPVYHPDHRYTFVLDNGQVWEQLEVRTGLLVDPNDAVTISPGVLGGFFLKTPGNQFIRVRRIR